MYGRHTIHVEHVRLFKMYNQFKMARCSDHVHAHQHVRLFDSRLYRMVQCN
jgi:hypothetical protein